MASIKLDTTLVIHADLSCSKCRCVINKYLCKIQCKERILTFTFDETKNIVLVYGLFNAECLKRKLLCKFSKLNIHVEITVVTDKKPDCEEKCTKKIEELYVYIEKWKLEWEVKCKEIQKECKEVCPPPPPKKDCKEVCPPPPPPKECKDACQKEPKEVCPKVCKKTCDNSCKCTGNCKYQEQCPAPIGPVCCARPCPCYASWCNNYKCCSCGTIGNPGWWTYGGGRPMICHNLNPPAYMIYETSPGCSIM